MHNRTTLCSEERMIMPRRNCPRPPFNTYSSPWSHPLHSFDHPLFFIPPNIRMRAPSLPALLLCHTTKDFHSPWHHFLHCRCTRKTLPTASYLEPNTLRPGTHCLGKTSSRHIKGRWNEGDLLRSEASTSDDTQPPDHKSRPAQLADMRTFLTGTSTRSLVRASVRSVQRQRVDTVRHHRPGDLLRMQSPWSVLDGQEGRLYTCAGK